MADPAAAAAQRALKVCDPRWAADARCMTAAAREALESIRECMATIRYRYEIVRGLMLAAETSAEMSRHANEMAGIKFAYDLLVPLIYTTEELER